MIQQIIVPISVIVPSATLLKNAGVDYPGFE